MASDESGYQPSEETVSDTEDKISNTDSGMDGATGAVTLNNQPGDAKQLGLHVVDTKLLGNKYKVIVCFFAQMAGETFLLL